MWYWASPIEARLCRQEEIVLIGGGNSAGQAAVAMTRGERRQRQRAQQILRRQSLSRIPARRTAPNGAAKISSGDYSNSNGN